MPQEPIAHRIRRPQACARATARPKADASFDPAASQERRAQPAAPVGETAPPNPAQHLERPNLSAENGPPTRATEPLPLSPDITQGVLDNGLTYYIRPNPRPARRAALRLLVNVGSVLEEDDERGFAHFVEHMAFNGTEKYARNEIVHILERAGVQFGQHTNASTTFDKTTYELVVPSDDPTLLETGVEMLHQLAAKATFTPRTLKKSAGLSSKSGGWA